MSHLKCLKKIVLMILWSLSTNLAAGQSLLVLAGAASKPPTELVAAAFTAKTGVKVDLIFGGSGYVLSQMQLGRTGDVYFPGSSDYMEKAKVNGLVVPESERKVVYLVNAINVRKGNPKGIKSLRDLARPGLRVAIANPEGVCVGLYAIEILEKNLKPEEVAAVKANIVNYPESCEKTATSISLATVDAVIGWRVFEHWDPERIETVPLAKEEIIRIGYIPVAISTFSQQPELAQQFIDFVISDEGRQYYRQYKYFTSVEEAAAWLGADKPVGGSWQLPESWQPK
ncbi:MAG: molybdate ABC transporter substrate-binding protein [Candidatus Riflebacteria bacterium HGW-Riflebacteria-2]|nr:MAG: molybdate ABC transporter substrate-binding protein [Candidatus Riflebacteria bacterium HGW-Riflebacteria-2]